MEQLYNKEINICRDHFLLNLLASTLFFLSELCIIILYIKDCISFSSLLLIHLCIITVIFIVLIILRKNNADIRIFILLFFETAILGPVGPLIIICILLLNRFIFSNNNEALDNILEIMESNYYTESDTLYNRLTFIKGSETSYTQSEPFIDIMQYGTLEEKQQVLIMIRRYFRPEYTNILFKALRDPENNIRVQAASLVAALQNIATEKFNCLKEDLKGAREIINSVENFIEFYEYYVETEIFTLNNEIAQTIDTILERLSIFRKQYPHDSNAHSLAGQLLFKINKYEESFNALKACAECGKCTRDDLTELILLEDLFELKKYNDLRYFASKASAKYNDNNCTNESLKEIIEFWKNK